MDSSIVKKIPGRNDIETLLIPATVMATKMGDKVIANMILLGALIEKTYIITKESLEKAIKDTIPSKLVELNLQAMNEGIKMIKAS